jgi:site-specific DNA recombinase
MDVRITYAVATAIYARISEDRQDGAGVERQLADCRRLVEGPAEEFTDPSISAFSGKVRPAYARLIDAVKRGEIDRIVCWKYDRLYRRPRELEDLLDLAESQKITIQAVMAGPLDLATSTGRTMARVAVAFSNQASEDTRERVKRQKQQAKADGKILGGPRAFGWRTESKGVLVQDATEVALIREAVDRLLAGASLNDIAKKWNADGVPTSQGRRDRKKNPDGPSDYRGRWTPQTVKNVMSNRRHSGSVIEATKWEQLQALLQRRSAFARVPRRRSLLTGVVTCSLCGARMVRTGAGNGRNAFRCPSQTGCGKVSIDAQGLESLLVEATLQRGDTGELAKIVRRMGKGGEQDRIVGELADLDQQADELYASWRAKRFPTSEYEKRTVELEADRRALTSKLARVTSSSVIAAFAGRGDLRASWDKMTTDQQREIIKLVLGKVEVTPVRKRGFPRFDRKRVRIA